MILGVDIIQGHLELEHIFSRVSSSAWVLTKFAIELVIQSRYHQGMNGVINKVNNGGNRTMADREQ